MPEHIKVRRILNNFYKRLSGQFAPDEVYSGDEIRQFAISAIKVTQIQHFFLKFSAPIEYYLRRQPKVPFSPTGLWESEQSQQKIQMCF